MVTSSEDFDISKSVHVEMSVELIMSFRNTYL